MFLVLIRMLRIMHANMQRFALIFIDLLSSFKASICPSVFVTFYAYALQMHNTFRLILNILILINKNILSGRLH